MSEMNKENVERDGGMVSERMTLIVVALTESERIMLEELLPQIPDMLEGTKEEIVGTRRIIDGLLTKIRTEGSEE